MKLEINVPVSGLDLANLLDGEQGAFLCQNRGQNYITVAKSGHSIAFGPTPIGKAIQEQAVSRRAPEPWFVTKISHSTDLAEFRGSCGRKNRCNCPRKPRPRRNFQPRGPGQIFGVAA